MFHPYHCQSVVCPRCWWTEFCTTSFLTLSGISRHFQEFYPSQVVKLNPMIHTPPRHSGLAPAWPKRKHPVTCEKWGKWNMTWIPLILHLDSMDSVTSLLCGVQAFFPNKNAYKPQMMKAKEFGSSNLTKKCSRKKAPGSWQKSQRGHYKL